MKKKYFVRWGTDNKRVLFTGCVFLLIFISGCSLKREVLIKGRTMGTTYHIKVIAGYFDSISRLKGKIEQRLKEINASMSVYDGASEISRFNSIQTTDEGLTISGDFCHVLREGGNLFRLTEGAWDGTVKPLVDLWGFSDPSIPKKIPLKTYIDQTLAQVGFSHIEISDNRRLCKKKAGLMLDLNSIAKGFAVDRIAALIRETGIGDFLVEIGGEVYASGKKKDKEFWRVGINRPQKDASTDQVYRVVTLQNFALATSGDYRNFFEIEGRRYSHVIDPRTGYPVENSVVSATVMAETCTFADGLATALMVMGVEKGIELADRLKSVEAMMVVRRPDGTLADYFSKGFKTLP